MENFLKYGALGLILALSILVYRLIRDALKKEKLSKHNFYVIFIFLGFVVLVMFIGIFGEQLKNGKAKTDLAKKQSAYTWTNYTRRGCNLSLPDVFKEKNITNDVQHYRSTVSDEINLIVDCRLCGIETNTDDLRQLYSRKLSEYPGVTYQIFKNNFFVVTGNKNDGKKYYYKGLLKNKSFYSMQIEYPASYQYLFDDVMTGISRSFK